MGATGFTSGLVNVAPRLSVAMLAALRAADQPRATAAWQSIRVFEELHADDASADNVSVVKEALALLGLAPAVRPPSREQPPDRRDVIAGPLARWSLHEASRSGCQPVTRSPVSCSSAG
jgi:4-hydroxy-tetrahydrodipicolinate synthase